MFMRLLLFLALSATSMLSFQVAPSGTQDKSCRRHPQLAGKCFNLHGRLSVYNGAPAMRIWKVGTKRMLGVSEQRFSLPGYRNIPDDVRSQVNQDVDLFGDFLVCPFTRPRAGEMQLVCVEHGKNLKVQKRMP